MNVYRVTILTLFVASIYSPTTCAGESVVIAAQEAQAVVAPRTARLRLVNLPELEFSLRATIKCKGVAESLTLSIADTLTTLDTDTIDGQRSAAATLVVPARQIALAASKNFCLSDAAQSDDELLVAGLATVHASLRCRTEKAVTVLYSSAPLQVRLLCSRPPASQRDQSPDR